MIDRWPGAPGDRRVRPAVVRGGHHCDYASRLMTTAPTLERWPLIGRRLDLELFGDALEDRAVSGFVIGGPAGVGKTRLADECQGVALVDGHATARVIASRAAASVPLGAIAHLIPPAARGAIPIPADADRAGEVHALFVAALHDLAATAPVHDQPVVIMVDDVHLLDTSSLALLNHARTVGAAFLVATRRADEPTGTALSAVLADPTVIEYPLAPLARADVDTLLHLALGGPLEGSAGASLWAISQGNALYLRELTLGALTSGALVEDLGVWHLQGPLTSSHRLRDLVEERIRGTGEDGRAILEWLAVVGPTGRSELEQMTTLEALDALAVAGLIEITEEQRRRTVSLTHALHAEAIRSNLGRLRVRGLLRDAVARVDARGARRRDDPTRIAMWQLAVDGKADTTVLLAAARAARAAHDFAEVERLADAILRAEPGLGAAAAMLGEARYELGHFDEADAALATAQQSAGTDHEHLHAAAARARNQFWGFLDPAAASATIAAARTRLGRAADRDELLALEATHLVYDGDPRAALALLDGMEAAPSPRGLVLRALPEAPALALLGRTFDALAIASNGFEVHMALGDEIFGAPPGTHIVAQVLALTHGGRLDEAAQLAHAGYDIAVIDRVPFSQIWFALELGTIATLRGRPATSLSWFREARTKARATGFRHQLALALAGGGMAAAQLGDVSGAGVARGELETLTAASPRLGVLIHEQALGIAWPLVSAGEQATATALLLEQAGAAADAGLVTSASWLWHDALRIDPDAPVVGRLADLAATSDSPLLTARAEHAAAVQARDTGALLHTADTFEALGLDLLADEATLAAADELRRAGDQRGGQTAAARAELILARCEGAQTPRSVRADTIVPLSNREREIARLAAQGLSSRDIGERLSLSVRTVNNHLQRAYTKLAITNRTELGDALGLEGGPMS